VAKRWRFLFTVNDVGFTSSSVESKRKKERRKRLIPYAVCQHMAFGLVVLSHFYH